MLIEEARSTCMPIVGRDRELDLLRSCLESARGGRGNLVLISGGSGVGKTALVEEFERDAELLGTWVMVGHCYDREETPPYGPWNECLGQLSTTIGDQSIWLPSPDDLLTPDQFYSQVQTFLSELCRDRPLVLILEDLHWADSGSLELLRFIGRSVESLPLLIVATYRADDIPRTDSLAIFVPLIVREARVTRIQLRSLDFADLVNLLRARYDLLTDEIERLSSYLMSRTDGHALFVVELLRTLEDERILASDDTGWHVGDLRHAPVPFILKQMIEARLERLSDKSVGHLAVAAVVGHDVPFEIWQAVTGSSEDTLLELADHAVAAHVVTASKSGFSIRFVHELVRDALYEDIPAYRRTRLHRKIGEKLAAMPDPDPDMVAYHLQLGGAPGAVEWLVRAAIRADRAHALETAVKRYEAAFLMLDAQHSEPETRGWLRLMAVTVSLRLMAATLPNAPRIDLTRRWVDEAVQLATETDDGNLTARAVALRGLLRCFGNDLRLGIADLENSCKCIEQLAPSSGLARQCEYEIDKIVNRGSRAVFLACSGCLAEARAEGERALAQNDSDGSSDVCLGIMANIHHALGIVHAFQGEPELASRRYVSSIEAYEALGHHYRALMTQRELLSLVVLPYQADQVALREHVADAAVTLAAQFVDVGANTQDHTPQHSRVPLLIVEGKWDSARQIIEESGAWRFSQGRLKLNFLLGPLARNQGDRSRAWQCVHDTWPDGPNVKSDAGFALYTLPLLLLGAALALDDGDPSAARSWIDAHRHYVGFMKATLGLAEQNILEAEWSRAMGNLERARQYANRALERAASPRQPLALIAAHRIRGQLQTDEGKFSDAADSLMESLELAETCSAPFERALTLVARTELDLAQGKPSDASESLTQARDIGLALGARPLLQRIQVLTDELTTAASRAPGNGWHLSRRELEVLRLVATGLTNGQVAQELYISPRTINAHLSSIYGKLGVPSRVPAIRFALEHDLV